MKNPFRFSRLLALTAALAPLTALAHPGHDGDHGLEWDFGHLAEHPLATLTCVLVLGAIGWTAWRMLRSPASPAKQRIK